MRKSFDPKPTSPKKPEVRVEENFVEYDDDDDGEWTKEDYETSNWEKEKKSESEEALEISPIQHQMDANIKYMPTPPPPGSRMREFRLADLESLIKEVFREADRTMEGEHITQYSV